MEAGFVCIAEKQGKARVIALVKSRPTTWPQTTLCLTGTLMTIDQITTEAMQLSFSSRQELAEKLVESLDFTEDGDLQRAWAGEAI